MRRSVRRTAKLDPVEHLARVIGALPSRAVGALRTIAERADLPLVAGSWEQGPAGCLVANVVRAIDAADPVTSPDDPERTVDLRLLDAIPEMSSRDLNNLIVAWDTAALRLREPTDDALRGLLRDALQAADAEPAERV